ncbi:MAG: ATP-binding cassette domain-containing protein [Gemmatimonadales bacterium]
MSGITVSGATRAFGAGKRKRLALHGCSFEAASGEIIGVVGPNGAGKTTLLRLIAGEIPLTSGSITVAGKHAGSREARRVVGYAADPPLVPPELTGVEWLQYLASHHASGPQERTRLVRWSVQLGALEEFGGRRMGQYSRGMNQRLALAAAALGGSVALVLDEVISGVDPLVAKSLRCRIAELAASGRIIVIASHDLATLEKLATRVLVLWRGRLAADVAVGDIVSQRVAELSLSGSGLASAERLLARFPGAVRTGEGVGIPLTGGLTMESVIAACHTARIAVAASRVRYRALEDVLECAARRSDERQA